LKVDLGFFALGMSAVADMIWSLEYCKIHETFKIFDVKPDFMLIVYYNTLKKIRLKINPIKIKNETNPTKNKIYSFFRN
jgi:hypothetical protein